jgi:hypothetical protein
MQTSLPEIFRPILWSYDFEKIDPAKHEKTIVVHAINYGSLLHWRWLLNHYGRARLRQILSTIPATELKPLSRHLASLVFGIERFNYAPRGTH